MNQALLSVKIDPKLKKEVQAFAEQVGLSVSAIVNNQLRVVVRERRIEFSEQLIPNKATAKVFREIEADVKAGRNLSPTFDSSDKLFDYLEAHAPD